jgi:predicted nucleotidyltransferase
MKKRDKILKAAKQRLTAQFGDKIKDVILFGSRAWGKPTRWSDYDIIVVVRGDYDWQFERMMCQVMAELDLDYEVVTQPLVISEEELKSSIRGSQPIFQTATKKGIYA